MEIIAALTLRTERSPDPAQQPAWMRATQHAVLTIVRDPQQAGRAVAFIHDDRGALVLETAVPVDEVGDLLRRFIQVLNPATGKVSAGVVPIPHPMGPGPVGGDDPAISQLARAQLASVRLADLVPAIVQTPTGLKG